MNSGHKRGRYLCVKFLTESNAELFRNNLIGDYRNKLQTVKTDPETRQIVYIKFLTRTQISAAKLCGGEIVRKNSATSRKIAARGVVIFGRDRDERRLYRNKFSGKKTSEELTRAITVARTSRTSLEDGEGIIYASSSGSQLTIKRRKNKAIRWDKDKLGTWRIIKPTSLNHYIVIGDNDQLCSFRSFLILNFRTGELNLKGVSESGENFSPSSPGDLEAEFLVVPIFNYHGIKSRQKFDRAVSQLAFGAASALGWPSDVQLIVLVKNLSDCYFSNSENFIKFTL